MHDSSLRKMRELLTSHGKPYEEHNVLDIGAQDVNGTYRPIVEELGFASYTGADIAAAKNVELVLPEREPWTDVVKDRYSLVISGQCLEHTRWPWVWIQQIASVTSDDGLVIVIAPWEWKIHRYPVDCWRILPDGMEALFEWGKLKCIAVGTSERDCFGVAKKNGAQG